MEREGKEEEKKMRFFRIPDGGWTVNLSENVKDTFGFFFSLAKYVMKIVYVLFSVECEFKHSALCSKNRYVDLNIELRVLEKLTECIRKRICIVRR